MNGKMNLEAKAAFATEIKIFIEDTSTKGTLGEVLIETWMDTTTNS